VSPRGRCDNLPAFIVGRRLGRTEEGLHRVRIGSISNSRQLCLKYEWVRSRRGEGGGAIGA
jgi:hypothetical protein